MRLAVLEAQRILTDAGVESPRVDAELLAAHVVGVPRGRLPMIPLVDQPVVEALRLLVSRRAKRVPLQHLTGTAAMGPIDVAVGPGVFIPRPETEALLTWGLAALDGVAQPLVSISAPAPVRWRWRWRTPDPMRRSTPSNGTRWR